MNLTQAEWETLSGYLDEGLDLPAESRMAWVGSLTGLDGPLKQKLRDLLAAPLDNLFLQTLPRFVAETPPSERLSDVGPYRLIRELGRGGMGAVWLAQRSDGLLKRQVALKLPHAGVRAEWFLKRFANEREILASLTHPNIARLYDAGLAEGDRPFIALEYVDGATLTDYCDRQRRNVRERIALFVKVLEAVQYAHARLVLHRDLKPSNILVSADGEIKLLDFGIAKLMSGGAALETELTELGGRALTLDYASPEQIAGEAMSTASDVYSLGVVLFELLCGERPYRLKRHSKGALEDAILSGEAMRPSQRTGDPAKVQARATTPKKLAAALKGDLDKIVSKALRKEAVARYATADAFADDLRRYLNGEPVLAEAEGVAYLAGKFIARHKLAAAASMAVVLSLAVGLGIALWQARVARREARTSAAVEKFLTDIFRANSSDQDNPVKARQTTARELLDIGASKVDSELGDSPQAKLRLLNTLAGLYHDLGLDDQAVTLHRKDVALARRQYGNDDPAIANALVQLAGDMHSSASVNQMQGTLQEASRLLDKKGDSTSLTRALLDEKWSELYYSTDVKKAEDYASQAVSIYRKYPPSVEFVEALFQQGMIGDEAAEYRQAIAQLGEALAVSRKLQGEPNPSLPRFYAYLGEAQESDLQFGPAEQSFRAALSNARALNGEDHVDTVQTTMRLGLFLGRISRPFEALQCLQKAREIVLRIRGANDPFHTPQVMLEYGWALVRIGQLEPGLEAIQQAIDNRRKNRPGTRYLAYMLVHRAAVLTEMGDYAGAKAALDESSAILKKINDKVDWRNAYYRTKLALAEGNLPEAARLVGAEPADVPNKEFSFKFMRDSTLYGEVALLRGDSAAAIRDAIRVREYIVASAQRSYFKDGEAEAATLEGRGYLLAKDPERALPLFGRAVELRILLSDPNTNAALADAYIDLAECQRALGNSDEARGLLLKARAIFASHPRLGMHHRRPLLEAESRVTKRL